MPPPANAGGGPGGPRKCARHVPAHGRIDVYPPIRRCPLCCTMSACHREVKY
ncbi:Hypothetical protein I596_3644 [Dokdonella koreensis DS-123]|uniref:Uncharacterized protein n=1 Tax=Dokdonella koreensis DS-123 TaxID=1300342 RepID=A0A167H9T7_9GAMM|nr:Hypothetical protein I596_3644 [Dokdonella koreensis DS-123]